MIEAELSEVEGQRVLRASWIDTPLGPMLAIGDDTALYLLEFAGRRGLEKEIERLRQKTKLPIISGQGGDRMKEIQSHLQPSISYLAAPKTESILQIEVELEKYFSGKSQEFKTPLFLIGTTFQKRVWEELQKIPSGETRSYAEIAALIGKPTAFRAVALANGANQFAIIIPCHRVINSNGALGGYGGGIKKKEWLLRHEKK